MKHHVSEVKIFFDGLKHCFAQTLIRTGTPPASQCISPFIALASPLDTTIILGVAASAARREEISVLQKGGKIFEHVGNVHVHL